MERTDLLSLEAIRDLLARYTWAGDRGDAAGVAACFAADGVLDVGEHGGRWEGREEIERQLAAVTERAVVAAQASGLTPGPVRHHVSSVLIDLEHHDEAVVRSYFLVLTAAGVDHWGRYRDRVAETAPGGPWHFVERRVRVDGHAPGSLVVPDPS